MRLTLPAAREPGAKGERAEVRVRLWDDAQGERGYITFHPEPGVPLEIRPEEFVPKAEPVKVLMIPQRGLTPEQEERAAVTIMPRAGETVTLYGTDWAPKANADHRFEAAVKKAFSLTPELEASALRLLAALGLDTDGAVDGWAVEALRQAHVAPPRERPEHVRRAVEDLVGDLVTEGIDWMAVASFERAHMP